MKAVLLPAYNNNLIRALVGMKVEEKPLPLVFEGEVLIKIEASPCNPSDIAFLRGGYNIRKSLPAVPGFEGVGVISEIGDGLPEEFIGKRISCFVQNDRSGTWSEFVVAKITDCIFLKEEMPMEQAACFAVNPFTAFALYEMAQQELCECIIQNAANGQVGKFIRVLAKNDHLKVINIVRKEDQVAKLKFEGEEYVLNSEDDHFKKDLYNLAQKLNATMAFDAVGGEITGLLMNSMPEDSELVLYGGLSGTELSHIDPMGIIFDRKMISGFNLIDWFDSLEDEEFEEVSDYLQDLFINGVFHTDIQASFGLNDIVKGIRTYISDMSEGKILIKP